MIPISRTGSAVTPKAGMNYGGWTLTEFIKAGGNGSVWKAISEDGEVSAVKILKRWTDAGWKRFAGEIALMCVLDDDGHYALPFRACGIAEGGALWIAMPLAETLPAKLGPSPSLDAILAAIYDIAEALRALHADNAAHRDIKPSNLFYYKERFVLGDLGLARYPGKAPVTQSGERVGPSYFMAPEMVDAKRVKDPRPSDVWSLMKTLVALSRADGHPPPGPITRTSVGMRVSDQHPDHPKILAIDALVESATRFDPNDRVTMTVVVDELKKILDPNNIAVPLPNTQRYSMSQFKVGDVVQLKSGGPKMTIRRFIGDGATGLQVQLYEAAAKSMGYVDGDTVCEWFHGTELKVDSFHTESLVLVES